MGKEIVVPNILESAKKFNWLKGAKLTVSPYDGSIGYIDPPETLFGFTYWAHCIPPWKPENMLILGYGIGVIAELTRKIWGAVKITGVDNQKYDGKYVEYKMHTMDAYKFVKDCTSSIIKKRYDYVVIDLYDNKGVPDFVFEPEFAARLREMATCLVSLNIPTAEFGNMRGFYDYGFKFLRHINVEGNTVSFWSV